MIKAPLAYKQQMEQHLRNHSYCLVTIGAINQLAQANAQITSGTAYISNNTMLFDDYSPSIRYVTLEQDWFKCDGSMYFPPRTTTYLYNQGAVSDGILDSLTIRFNTLYDIKGLTIEFAPGAYPTAFTVTNGTASYSYTNDNPSWITTDIFDGTSYLTITATAMSHGSDRLRIDKMFMGVGISWDNRSLVNVEKTETVSPITDSLPTLDLSVTVDNYDGSWDVNNPRSSINYLESGQEIKVSYGYELNDGSIYWMNGATAKLKTWQADDRQMSMTATDQLADLTDTYYRGVYGNTTLYDLAIDVLTDAGVDPREYYVDPYLQQMDVINPMPPVTHAEALQIIANAGRCKLYCDRDDKITIKSAIELQLNPSRMTITSDDATEFSDLKAVIDGRSKINYAMLTKDYWKTDSTMFFIPRGKNYLVTGFVSKQMAMGHAIYPATDLYPSSALLPMPEDTAGFGTFDVNPKVTIYLEAASDFYTMTITFREKAPGEMILHSYLEDTLQESYTMTDLELDNVIEHEFPRMDKLVIEFTKAPVYNRIYLDSIIFGDQTDFAFSRTNMSEPPLGTKDEKVKDLNVIKTSYSHGTELQNVMTATADLTGIDSYTFYFSSPTHDATVLIDGSSVMTITDSSTYYITVNTASYSGEHEMSVNGYTWNVSETVYTKEVNTTGVTEEWSNPLVSNDTLASLQAEWIADYLANNIQYDLTYRGEPRIDAGDLAFMENEYINGLTVRVIEHSIAFNGALSGTATCRLAEGSA